MALHSLLSNLKAPYELLPLCTDLFSLGYFQQYLSAYNDMLQKMLEERKRDFMDLNAKGKSDYDEKRIQFRKKRTDIDIQELIYQMEFYYKKITDYANGKIEVS